jgi:hypothetical protein
MSQGSLDLQLSLLDKNSESTAVELEHPYKSFLSIVLARAEQDILNIVLRKNIKESLHSFASNARERTHMLEIVQRIKQQQDTNLDVEKRVWELECVVAELDSQKKTREKELRVMRWNTSDMLELLKSVNHDKQVVRARMASAVASRSCLTMPHTD